MEVLSFHLPLSLPLGRISKSEIRRRDYGCTFATSYVRFHEIAVRHQYDEWKQICIFQKIPAGFGILMKLNEPEVSPAPSPLSNLEYFPIFVLSLFFIFIYGIFNLKFLHDYIYTLRNFGTYRNKLVKIDLIYEASL